MQQTFWTADETEADERTCRICGKCWTAVTEAPNIEKHNLDTEPNCECRRWVCVTGYTEEFDMVWDWNNGSIYNNLLINLGESEYAGSGTNVSKLFYFAGTRLWDSTVLFSIADLKGPLIYFRCRFNSDCNLLTESVRARRVRFFVVVR